MSIDLYTGLLLDRAANLAASPEDADIYEFYTGISEEVNLFAPGACSGIVAAAVNIL